jgi:HAD superfamily hydrolase (TIGR01509 family)
MDALLVDLYDTIVWTEWPLVLERLSGRLGIEGRALLRGFEATRTERGTGRFGSVQGDLRAVVTACGGTPDEALLAELAAESVTFLQRNIRLYDDVLPVLRRARAAGTRVAVVSNCDHATRPVIDGLGLGQEVDALVLSFEVRSVKPEARIFGVALERLGAAAGKSVFVDDQARYLDGAAALGIRTFRMARERHYGERSEPGPHPVISSLTALFE